MTNRFFLILVIFCCLIIGYTQFIEPQRITVTNYELTTKKWQSERPLRIALIANVHAN